MGNQNLHFDLVEKRLREAQLEIKDGWLLNFRGQGLFSSLIRLGSNGPWTHSGLSIWTRGELMCAEIREFKGGRIVTLKSQVKRYPGQIDVFEPDFEGRYRDTYSPSGAADYMMRLAGCDYGWYAVMQASLVHMPLVRLAMSAALSKFAYGRKFLQYCRASQYKAAIRKDRPPFCSMAADAAYLLGGNIDVIPNLESRLTEPTDLARSMFFKYRFSLVP